MKINRIDLYILLLFLFIGGVLSLILGRDVNWDFANYHYYSAWALFHNRIGFDIMPGGIQSYLNPLIDLPLYFMIKFFNNNVLIISLYQSIWYSLSLFLAYKICFLIFKDNWRYVFIVPSMLIGATGILAIWGIGISCGDINMAVYILFAIYLFLKNLYNDNSKNRSVLIFIASLILGIATGLKMTNSMCIFGILSAEILLSKRFQNPIKIIIITITGVAIGYVLTAGWWHYLLWQKFGNPVFPYYNNIFHSPFANDTSCMDIRHLQHHSDVLMYLYFPFYFCFNDHNNLVMESKFIDFRSVVFYISVLFIMFVNFILPKLTDKNNEYFKYLNSIINIDILNFLTLQILFVYIYWLNAFGTLRYLTFLEFLSGIYASLLIVYITLIFQSKKIMTAGVTILTLVILFTTKYCCYYTKYPIDFKQLKNEKYIYCENFNLPDDSLLLYLGGHPGSFCMPFQNPKARLIFLYGETRHYSFQYPKQQENFIKKLINKNLKKTYLFYSDIAFNDWDYVKIFINKNDFQCREVNNNSFRQTFFFCTYKGNNFSNE